MIAHISGTVLDITERYVVVDTGSLGYKVFASAETLDTLTRGSNVSLYTYLAVREDALDLYGFLNSESREFFELLISVSGIGPKSALGILSITAVATLKKAIATGDVGYLTKVSGIGKKTAEKIVIELRDKLLAHKDSETNLQGDHDALEALKSLGYSQQQAREVLNTIDSSITDINLVLKEALKKLGGK